MQNRRSTPRLREANSVAIKIMKSPEAPELEGETFFSTTADVSVGGVCFTVHTPVPRDAVLELRVGFSRPLGAFRHLGKVAWIKTSEEGDEDHDIGVESYTIGVEFLKQPAEKMVIWRDIIDRKVHYAGADEIKPEDNDDNASDAVVF